MSGVILQKLLIFFLLCLLTGVLSHGQYTFNSTPVNSGHYRLQHFNSDNGLPQNSVKGMEFDKYGNIWMGTESGLVMFDGMNFRTEFNIHTGIRIIELFKQENGKISFYDNKNNAYVIDEEKGIITQILADDQKKKDHYKYLMQSVPYVIIDSLLDQNASIYLRFKTTVDNYYLKSNTGHFFYFDSTQIRGIELDNSFTGFKPFLAQMFCFNYSGYSIYENGNLIRSNNKVYDFETRKIVDFDLSNAFYFREADQPFMLLGDKLYEMILDKGRLYIKKIIENLPDFGPLKYSNYDPKQKIWALGSHLVGLFLIQQSPVKSALSSTFYKKDDEKSRGYYSAVSILLELNDGGKLTNRGYIYYKDGSFRRVGKYMMDINSFFTGGQKWIYACDYSNNKLNILNRNLDTLNITDFSEHLGSIYEISEDRILLLTYNHFLMLYPQENYRIDTLYSEERDIFNRIYRYDNDIYWLLTTDGILQFSNDFKDIKILPGSENIYFRQCSRLSNGELIVFSYGNGYFMYRNETFIPLPVDRDGYLKFAHYFLEDSNGFLWIPTNKGFFQMSVDDLMAYSRGELMDIYYNYYDKSYGFYNNEFNGGGNMPGLIAEEDDYFWLGNLVGPVLLNPYIFPTPLPENPIRIQWIEVADSLIYGAPEFLKFNQGFNRTTFHVSSAYFGHPKNLRMEYRIAGADERWYPVDANNSFTINNLPDGNYELEIRKLKGFGKDNYDLLTYKFVVLPYFWETWWFSALLVLAAIIGVVVLIQIRTLRLNKRNIALERIVSERTKVLENSILDLERASEKNELMISIITHDIKGPLRFISQIMNNLKESFSKLSQESLKTHLETLAGSTEKLYHFVLEFLQWFQLNQELFEGQYAKEFVLNEALLSIKDFAYATGIVKDNVLHIEEDEAITIVNKRPLIETIVRNLIENACKNTKNGKIVISCSLTADGKRVGIDCSDNGKGMTKGQIEQIYEMDKQGRVYFENRFHLGYGLIFNLLKEIDGDIDIISEPGQGTIVKISFPAIV